MKISIIALFLLVTSANIVSAQVDYKPIRLAFVLSPQLSWVKSDNENIASGGNLFGYNFGVTMHKFFAPNYALNTGLTVNTTGGVIKSTTGSGVSRITETTTMRLKYLEIPFGLHLETNEFRRMVYYGQFGLSTMLNIKATDQDGESLNSKINSFDFAYHFGGGVEYSIGGSNFLMLGLQFNNGITEITSKSAFGYKDRAILNRLVFQFGLIF